MNSVDEVQEIVEITINCWAAKSVWPIQKKGVVRTKSRKGAKLAAASGSAIRSGDAKAGVQCVKARSATCSCVTQTSNDRGQQSARWWMEEARSCLVSKNRTLKVRALVKGFR